jgi:hypothetical protein
MIAKLRREGLSTYDAIAVRLNAMGIATSRGAHWHASTVKNVESRSRKLSKSARA